jgi:hypothetical protein
MKLSISLATKKWVLFTIISTVIFSACQKQAEQPNEQPQAELSTAANQNGHGHLQQTKTFSSDVVIKWLNLDLDLLRTPLPAGTAVQGGERILAYSGIALYEAVVKGMPAYQSLVGQLTAFPAMPTTEPGKAYHWAAAANAALAQETRYLFDTASTSTNLTIKQQRLDKINALEKTLQDAYATEVDAATLQRSISFGKDVASRVSAWLMLMDINYKALHIHRCQIQINPGFGCRQHLHLLCQLTLMLRIIDVCWLPVLITAPLLILFHLFLQLQDQNFMKWQMMSILNHCHQLLFKRTWPCIFVIQMILVFLVITADQVITLPYYLRLSASQVSHWILRL